MIDSTSCGDCVEVPNVFTPANGDDINDEFIPYKSCDAEYANYKFVIYNRWGQKVLKLRIQQRVGMEDSKIN